MNPTPAKWEEEFDEKFYGALGLTRFSSDVHRSEIKSFIRSYVTSLKAKIENEIDDIEKDALEVGLEKQSQDIIKRFRARFKKM